jgi:hypothetical protein
MHWAIGAIAGDGSEHPIGAHMCRWGNRDIQAMSNCGEGVSLSTKAAMYIL